jgi:hypothetical protein
MGEANVMHVTGSDGVGVVVVVDDDGDDNATANSKAKTVAKAPPKL